MDDSSLPGHTKPPMPNLSRRRPSLQIDGILMSDRDESKTIQGMKPRMSLTGGTLLDPSITGGTRRGTLVAAGAPTLLGSIQSRSTRALYESTEIKETLDAKTYDDETSGERRLNQYVLGKVLGKGSFGTVYRAMDKDSGREVAIKEFSKNKLRKQKAQKSGMLLFGRGRGRGRGGLSRPPPQEEPKTPDNPIELVRSEIAILKKLDHINVVKLFEVLDDPNQDSLFMVFELCEKGCIIDVSMEKSTKPLPIETTRNYFRQMILGIEYLHENNISHRDIKPDNMMISDDGTVKIVDFGVSEMFKDDSDKLSKSAGSPAFYPPENCAAGHGELSAKAHDLWAMGVTLYCMLFGTLPFTGSNILQLYENIRSAPVPLPNNTDPLIHNLFLKILDKNPDTRMTMDQLREHPWVTERGANPLMTKDENCYDLIGELTDLDLNSAIKPIGSLFTVIKAISKLKRGKSNLLLSSQNSGSTMMLSAGSSTSVTNSKGDLGK